jgi:hypothetical protein
VLIDIPAQADTAVNARKIAENMAKAMGYRNARVIAVRQAGDVDVGDAGMMLAAMRSWVVQMDAVR